MSECYCYELPDPHECSHCVEQKTYDNQQLIIDQLRKEVENERFERQQLAQGWAKDLVKIEQLRAEVERLEAINKTYEETIGVTIGRWKEGITCNVATRCAEIADKTAKVATAKTDYAEGWRDGCDQATKIIRKEYGLE